MNENEERNMAESDVSAKEAINEIVDTVYLQGLTTMIRFLLETDIDIHTEYTMFNKETNKYDHNEVNRLMGRYENWMKEKSADAKPRIIV